MNKKPNFNIGDKVFHITKDSDEGIVIDICYWYKSNQYEYVVTTGFGKYDKVYEEELTYNKTF